MDSVLLTRSEGVLCSGYYHLSQILYTGQCVQIPIAQKLGGLEDPYMNGIQNRTNNGTTMKPIVIWCCLHYATLYPRPHKNSVLVFHHRTSTQLLLRSSLIIHSNGINLIFIHSNCTVFAANHNTFQLKVAHLTGFKMNELCDSILYLTRTWSNNYH